MSAINPQSGLGTKFSHDKFGDSTVLNVNPVAALVGTTPTQILANNPERIAFIIVNRDAAAIGLSFTNAVTLTNQISLGGGGTILTLTVEDDGELVTYPVFAISAAGGAIVYVLEVERG